MARPLRVKFEFEDAIYHVCSRGNARQRIFWDDRDWDRFIELDPTSAWFARNNAAAQRNV
jgi:hypothetical protein